MKHKKQPQPLPQGRILLLSCCAPCSCAVIKKLHEDGVDFAVAFYNPNIYPETEYSKRKAEQQKLCRIYAVEFIEMEYNPQAWLKAASPYKDAPERGARCSVCFEFRLRYVMQYAKTHGFDFVASVLGVSRWKDLNQVNAAAARASATVNFPYIEVEGRKFGMQEQRAALIKELGLYNQEYCGCVYSYQNHLKDKAEPEPA